MVNLSWMGDKQREFLKRDNGYLQEGVSPEQRYQEICNTIEDWCFKNGHIVEEDYTTKGIGKRFEEYISDNITSFSSPVLANFGCDRGLPISCNHGKITDTLEDILSSQKEMCLLAKYGAGTAKNFSSIRGIGEEISTGGKSSGIMPWIELYAKAINNTTQSSVRRGFLTAYLSVDHPEILDFLDIGTDKYSPISEETISLLIKLGIDTKEIDKLKSIMQSITTAVTLPVGFREKLKNGDTRYRKIWAKILKNRAEIGYPYILDVENCNKGLCKAYTDKGLIVDNSNICIEAMEYCDSLKEFACCLSSLNIAQREVWSKYPYLIKDHFVMLDCVISEYIDKGSKLTGLEKAVRFAKEHRAIGLGTLGFHTYLQSKMISMESFEARTINDRIFKELRQEGEIATKLMAKHWGEPKILEGYGRRNTSLMAQAPTKSTSFIMGMPSSSIEPIKNNFHEKKLAKIQVEFKNPKLVEVLESKGKNDRDTWASILEKSGSVQHLGFLTDQEKEVFKCFHEISQMDLINLAADRQKYIDMGQSLNLMIHPNTPPKEINKIHLAAFDLGLKSLYYQYSINAAQSYNEKLMTCSSCEG